MSTTNSRRFAGLLVAFLLLTTLATPVSVRAAGPWYVSTTGDDNNDCLSPSTACATINGAIAKASGGESVLVAAGTYTGTGAEVVLIDREITLSGGWDGTFTSQAGTSIIDGEAARRGITINSVTASLERFTVQHGFQNTFASGGAGILNELGTVTLNRMTITGNAFVSDFGGGGGIYNSGTLVLNFSMISGNSVDGYQASGAGILNRGTLTINNSSVIGNRAGANSGTGPGGGVYNAFGSVSLNNSTISNNTADSGAGLYTSDTLNINNTTITQNVAFSGGGLLINAGSVTMQNSILAGNIGGGWPDCVFPPTSAGYNIIGNATSCNFSGTTGDQLNVDPKITPLIGDPGYFALRSDSPAIDAGNPSGCMGSEGALTTDQRGAARSGVCDIGAYEYTTPGSASSLVIVNGNDQRAAPTRAFPRILQTAALDDIGSPVPGVDVTFTAPASGASGTFVDTGTNTSTVTTDAGGIAAASTFTANDQFGSYTVTGSASGLNAVNFNLANAAWFVSNTGNDSNSCSSSASPCATIKAAIARADAGNAVFVAEGVYSDSGEEVVLANKDILLLGGWDTDFTTQNGTSIIDGQHARRGVTVNNTVSALLERFTIQNGNSLAGGSGVFNFGTLTIDHSTIRDNGSGSDGSGILNLGVLTVNNSSINNNHGGSGGGISNGSSGFGLVATTIINNSTVSGNSGSSRGGGIGNFSGGILILNNTTVSGNQDEFFPGGGGIYNDRGNVTLQNSLIAGNTKTSGASSDCDGSIISLGYNLIGSTSGCIFNATTGDQTDIDPNLGPLVGLSGSPFYHPLLSGSPAIDAGNPAGCTDQDGNVLGTDQRGVARVGTCDIGSYEFTTPGAAASISIAGGDHQTAATTFAFPELLQVAALDALGTPVSGITVEFAAPASGPSGTFADTASNTTSAVTDSSGVATASVFTANDQQGAYLVAASASGLGSVEFDLEQISRPHNDNLANATVITALPYSDTLDNTNATMEPNEQSFCGGGPQTNSVWYSFTPASTVVVGVDMAGSSFSDVVLTIYTAPQPNFNNLSMVNRSCSSGFPVTFTALAGQTFYIQAQSISSGGGELHLNAAVIPGPDNDDFADAETITSLPASRRVDLTGATQETNEPQVCFLMDKTAWYLVQPQTTTMVRLDTNGGISANVNIYRSVGPGITDLQFMHCTSYFGVATVQLEAGQSYYLQVGALFGQSGTAQINLTEVASISGRITDAETNLALPGDQPPFTVATLQRICGPGCVETIGMRNVDANGRFVFADYFGNLLPSGTYQIEASADSYQRTVFGPFEFTGVNLDVGDLPLAHESTGVNIDIMPGSATNMISLRSLYIQVAVLSSEGFNAVTDINRSSLTFGRTGIEASLSSCAKRAQDVNNDGRADLVCYFRTLQTGLTPADTQAVLRGVLLTGAPFEASDVVTVVKRSK